jgi:hypothetical protein
MASIRNRNGAWQVRSSCKSQVFVSKLFTTRHDAERWAHQIKSQIDQGRFVSLTPASVSRAISKYYVPGSCSNFV